MRLISGTVRNCRLHRELKVEFEPSRTLIGGPNETGKSTLIEALHRALFLKAKGNTEQHRALSSTLHHGPPEVELVFEAAGQRYHLKKRFGVSGTTTLAPASSVALAGEAAETELARVLALEVGVTGRAVTTQWAHLWVWQGQAGDDPSVHATAQQAGLLTRLQQIGGAAALQSERDARVARHFAETRRQLYTQTDKPKAGSELDRAERAVAQAQAELAQASERLQKLLSAIADLDTASQSLQTATTSIQELEGQQEALEQKTRQLAELRQHESDESHVLRAATDRQGALATVDEQIKETWAEITALEGSLQPQTEAIARGGQATLAARERAAAAESAYRTALEAVRAARLRHELALAQVQRFEKTALHARLAGKQEKVSQRQRVLAELEHELAKLPRVDPAALARLLRLESAGASARAALQAMATGLEIVASDLAVQANGQPVEVGTRQILTADTELTIGAAVRLRIQPGGGTTLAEASQTHAQAQAELQAALDALEIPSVLAAGEFKARRDELDSRIRAAQAELEGLGAEGLADELHQALNELQAVQASVERRAEAAAWEQPPADPAAAKALAKTLAALLSQAGDQETEARVIRDGAAEALEAAGQTLRQLQAAAEQQGVRLTGLKAQHELLLRTHGDDAARARACADCEAATAAARNRLQDTTAAIAVLQPELLEGDRKRIERAIKERTNERNDARTGIALAQAALRSDGSEDPQSAATAAATRLRSATDYGLGVSRKAQAIALLDTLFENEQRTLSEQFTQPLAERISGYLQCLFGADARAQVDLEANEFTGLRLSRSGFGAAPFAFETLSGGAREQMAAAVRLAMAEVLAAGHDGCLPVVFDDAFAYSDPERVVSLQRMLDLGAERGLQIIILTCNPADYAALGARQVLLRPPAPLPNGPSAAPPAPMAGAEGLAAGPGDANLEGTAPASAAGAEASPEVFLARLLALGGKAGNGALRDSLGWNETTYEAVKGELVANGRILPGRGRGGTVALAG